MARPKTVVRIARLGLVVPPGMVVSSDTTTRSGSGFITESLARIPKSVVNLLDAAAASASRFNTLIQSAVRPDTVADSIA